MRPPTSPPRRRPARPAPRRSTRRGCAEVPSRGPPRRARFFRFFRFFSGFSGGGPEGFAASPSPRVKIVSSLPSRGASPPSWRGAHEPAPRASSSAPPMPPAPTTRAGGGAHLATYSSRGTYRSVSGSRTHPLSALARSTPARPPPPRLPGGALALLVVQPRRLEDADVPLRRPRAKTRSRFQSAFGRARRGPLATAPPPRSPRRARTPTGTSRARRSRVFGRARPRGLAASDSAPVFGARRRRVVGEPARAHRVVVTRERFFMRRLERPPRLRRGASGERIEFCILPQRRRRRRTRRGV